MLLTWGGRAPHGRGSIGGGAEGSAEKLDAEEKARTVSRKLMPYSSKAMLSCGHEMPGGFSGGAACGDLL
jgi:hypothetical protein